MARPKAATSPALAVCGRGRAKDPRGQKRRKICSSHSHSTDVDESFHEDLWKMLPEDVFNLVVERLPFGARCRFRCLCQRWKEIQFLSPPPPVTIMSKAGDQNAVFYCDAERKWISLPSNRHVPSGRTWELVDADAGLVCYRSNIDIDGWARFWVCNPLKPSLSRLIQPEYAIRDTCHFTPRAPHTKLLVDRASGTYKIIVVADRLPCTSVYESTTCRWETEERSPCMIPRGFFVWSNMLYAYNTEKDLQGDCLSVFHLQRRRWSHLTVKMPSEVDFPTNRFFLSNNEEVVLVLYSCRKLYRPYFSVWKLLDDAPKSAMAPFCEFENWVKIELGSVRDVADLRGHRLAGASYRGEHICFVFRGKKTTPDGFQGYKIVRYSFAAKSWSQMTSCADQGGSFGLHNWKPSLDVDPS